MSLGDASPLGISLLLMLLIVAMILIDQVLKLAQSMLQMSRTNFDIIH